MVLSASFLILLLCWSLFALRGDSLTKQTRSITSLTKQKFLKMSTTTDADNKLYSTVGALGLLSNVVVDYSLYTLKTTGCGLPAGPFGLVGAAEGISYLAVVGLLGWSIFSKIKTGSGNMLLLIIASYWHLMAILKIRFTRWSRWNFRRRRRNHFPYGTWWTCNRRTESIRVWISSWFSSQ